VKTDLEEMFEIESGHGATEELLRHNRVLCYKTRTIRCGDVTEVEAYPIYSRAYPDAGRMKERIRSSKAQQALNDRRAEDRFRRKAEANFGSGDYFLTLTYDGTAPTMDQALRDCRNFLARVNRARKKKGLPRARYMAVVEAGNRNGRAHHHFLIDGGLSREEYETIWGKGQANCDRLRLKNNGLMGLCKYLLKNAGAEQRAKDAKRWMCSRNLKEPKITESVHKVTKRQAARIAQDAELQGDGIMRKLYPGTQLMDLSVRRSDFLAGAYIFARLIRTGGGAICRI